MWGTAGTSMHRKEGWKILFNTAHNSFADNTRALPCSKGTDHGMHTGLSRIVVAHEPHCK